MARFFQFSTQSERSLPNARLALDVVRSLHPLQVELSALGSVLPTGARGHAWAFSPKSHVAKADQFLQPGDLGLRIEPDRSLRRIYEVLAFLPNRGDLPELINGAPWREGGEPYPNVVVFKPFVSVPPRHFGDFVDRHIVGSYVTGPRFEARFLPLRFEEALSDLIGSVLGPSRPESLTVPFDRVPGRRNLQAVRDGGSLFRYMVFAAQRQNGGIVECAACDVADERILEAAHIVDYGYIDDAPWNGLPLCRNHHRLFDLAVLRCDPDTGDWESNGPLADHGVTKAGTSTLHCPPHPDALRWRMAWRSPAWLAGEKDDYAAAVAEKRHQRRT